MATALQDERTFESAVPLTQDQKEANRQHFLEKGLDIEIENEGAEADGETPPETAETAETVETVETPEVPEVPEVPETPSVETPEPAVPVVRAEPVDAETEREWTTAKNDGEKLGRLAKKTKVINDLKGTVAERDGTIAELRRQLDEKNRATNRSDTQSQPPTLGASPNSLTTAPAAREPSPEPAKAKEFDKPKPVRPKFADFQSSDDPIAAHADAVSEWNEKLIDWRDEKRDFDARERTSVAEQTQQSQRNQQTRVEIEREINDNLQAARTAHADFDRTTDGKFTHVLAYVLREGLPGINGMELGYQLAQSENTEILSDLMKSTQTVNGESARSIERKILQATRELGIVNERFKNSPDSPVTASVVEQAPAAPAAHVVPAAPRVVAPVPAATVPQQTPPAPKPPVRREEAAPAPVRGSGASADRYEDIDPLDSDARRAWKKRHGVM